MTYFFQTQLLKMFEANVKRPQNTLKIDFQFSSKDIEFQTKNMSTYKQIGWVSVYWVPLLPNTLYIFMYMLVFVDT